jgi:ribonuclease HII
MVRVPTKTLERSFFAEGYDRIIAVDEVGMACLAGPVVVCAVSVGPDVYASWNRKLARMRDSKMLQPHQREYFAEQLVRIPDLRWQIASCDPETIDRLNIYQASRLAMCTAIKNLELKNKNCIVLVDGNKEIKELALPQKAIVKGDRKIWAIAAASILAKVHRDRLMADFAKEYPGYGLEIHKGYPTKMHCEQLKVQGPCPLHRRSFRLTR